MNAIATPAPRVNSIDLLRGLVMIIMALDHTRDYFHWYSFMYNPADMAHTSPAIFFTRWITHFCAPIFVFLAGASAFLSGQKKTKKELSIFLLKRGLWLMLLEITLVGFGWFFNPGFSVFALQVIWALGLCMILLAGIIHLPFKWIIAFGLILVFGHNILDGIRVPGNDARAYAWSTLHAFGVFNFRGITVLAAYPVIPWVAVMALGYCFGSLYVPAFDSAKRRQLLVWMGVGGIILFILLRWSNVYGDPSPWSTQRNGIYTILSFLNTTKYPPSLLYLLMTIPASFLLLAAAEKINTPICSIIATYGRVPLLYYLVHIYLLHALGIWLAYISGFGWENMIIKHSWITDDPHLRGYGLGLPMVYLIWLIVVVSLYPMCKAYDRYKRSNKQKWWLSYL